MYGRGGEKILPLKVFNRLPFKLHGDPVRMHTWCWYTSIFSYSTGPQEISLKWHSPTDVRRTSSEEENSLHWGHMWKKQIRGVEKVYSWHLTQARQLYQPNHHPAVWCKWTLASLPYIPSHLLLTLLYLQCPARNWKLFSFLGGLIISHYYLSNHDCRSWIFLSLACCWS